MENIMETTTVYRGYIGIMENRMETTIVYRGYTTLTRAANAMLTDTGIAGRICKFL